jgi:prepilin-type N-terminal cleavage/methylation domain-containing protein
LTGVPPGRGDDGFTLVEVMVASLLLLVGILTVLWMYNGALRTTTTSNSRVTATNLVRELVETAREIDYSDLQFVTAEAQARGLGSGSPWIIERRGVAYRVTATTCVFDSPTDAYAATAPANACRTNAVGVDNNGDDFRRVTFDVRWDDAGRERLILQAALIVNPAGGLGPRILSISPLTQTITANVGSVGVAWTSTAAQSLFWDVDNGLSKGSISGTTSFTATWNIGTSGSGSEVFDGSYTMTARSFDERGVPGESRRADIVLNRRAPYAPTGFVGGHNTRAGDWVELEWLPNRERDILGYRVVWAGSDDTLATPDDKQVCPAPASGSLLPPTTTSCADFSAESGSQVYSLMAIDRDAGNSLRAGDARTRTVSAAGSPPRSPLVLAVLTVGGLPRLTWTAPLFQDVAFYRIYRDGTTYAHRYDRTSGGLIATYTDTDPGAGWHSYWVTSVDSDFNESDPVGPVWWFLG